jgi:hypothetical protein
VTTLAEETEAYQVMLEGHRLDPDNDELWQDMRKAWAAMETAWLEERWAKRDPPTSGTSESPSG